MSPDRTQDWRESSEEASASDGELVAAYRDHGRGNAFGELVRRHQIAVFRVLLAVMAAGDEAEQACEDCFVQAARDIADLVDPDGFSTWVLRMARGRATTDPGASVSMGTSVPGDHMRNAVRAAILRLSPDARAALMLFELEGKDTEAIALILAKSVEEIEETLDRARREFIEALQEPPLTTSPFLAVAPLGPGSVIDGRYRLGAELGKGAMGAVHRAYHLGLEREVAVKVIQPAADANMGALRERFRLEAALLGRTEHEHVVKVIDFGETPDGALYLVLELLDGQTLAERIRA
ncbi:MAG: protein kinase, partial [Myxococcota bacterium]